MEESGLMEKILIYGLPMLILLAVLAYQFNKMRSNLALINKKYRYGAIVTALMMGFPVILFLISIGFAPEIKAFIGVDSTIVTVVLFLLMFILMFVVSLIMHVPIDPEKYRAELRAKKAGYKDWRYYIIEQPYETILKSVSVPSWKGTPSHQEFMAWNEKTKDTPPTKIQLLILLISWIITSGGLAIVGFLSRQWFLVILNLTLIPFFMFTIILAPLIFWLIQWSELVVSKIAKRKLEFTQAQKFMFYNLGYILLVLIAISGFWLLIQWRIR